MNKKGIKITKTKQNKNNKSTNHRKDLINGRWKHAITSTSTITTTTNTRWNATPNKKKYIQCSCHERIESKWMDATISSSHNQTSKTQTVKQK